MNYQIVVTLGPATNREDTWQMLLEAGATAFRLNTSHFGLEELEAWLARVDNFLAKLADQKPVGSLPLILDLQAGKFCSADPASRFFHGCSIFQRRDRRK